MAQFARPDADQATGTWSATPLWSKVDEGSPGDDTTIASADNASPDNADLRLSDVGDPASSSGHIIRVAWNKNATGGHTVNAVAELYQGVPDTGTLIASLTVSGIGATEQVDTHTLTGTEADSITDYTDLYLRLSRQGDTGGNPSTRRSLVVDFAELELPDAATVVVVGLASESDGAFAARPWRNIAVGLAADAESALPATAGRTRVVGLAGEADSVPSIGHAKGVRLGLPVEADSASAVQPDRARAVGLVGESDSALAVAPVLSKIVAVGFAAESDSALPLVPARSVSIAIAIEVDAALAVASPAGGSLGLAGETDGALPLSARRAHVIGPVGDTAAALPVGVTKTVTVGRGLEADSVMSIATLRAAAVGLVGETDTALGLVAESSYEGAGATALAGSFVVGRALSASFVPAGGVAASRVTGTNVKGEIDTP